MTNEEIITEKLKSAQELIKSAQEIAKDNDIALYFKVHEFGEMNLEDLAIGTVWNHSSSCYYKNPDYY